ncbi:MAG TPA: hypothetical protein VGP93_19235 [Polyangiaceae bacterium]|nr:hypothetical protein [Polyangiaceae bacterium]
MTPSSSSGRENPHVWHADIADGTNWVDDGNPEGLVSAGSQTRASSSTASTTS